jgi:hypothetical protein
MASRSIRFVPTGSSLPAASEYRRTTSAPIRPTSGPAATSATKIFPCYSVAKCVRSSRQTPTVSVPQGKHTRCFVRGAQTTNTTANTTQETTVNVQKDIRSPPCNKAGMGRNSDSNSPPSPAQSVTRLPIHSTHQICRRAGMGLAPPRIEQSK